MRHVPLERLLAQIFADQEGRSARQRLVRAHLKLAGLPPASRKSYTASNGADKWRPIKDRFTEVLGRKCWYTEVELVGAPLTIDHYRPVCDYWWLAFDAENYRVACPWANSPEHNPLHGCAGGKGELFPLLEPGLKARGKSCLRIEQPVILDPCNLADCDLLAFHSDGRPVLSPDHADDPVAKKRVDESKILLNLDHPDLNAKRERLCNEIAADVHAYEELPSSSSARLTIRTRIASRLAAGAPFSTAARFYLRLHRHLDWVEAILRQQ